jgi:hypothetical protein
MHGSVPLLVVFFAPASRCVCGMARNLNGGDGQSSRATRPTLFGRIFERMRRLLPISSPESTLLQFEIVL